MTGAEATRVELPASVGMDTAISLAERMKSLGSGAIVLDAGAVDTMSTPFVLTLVSAVRSRGEEAPRIQVENPSTAFLDAFSDLGLFGDLMKMEFPT